MREAESLSSSRSLKVIRYVPFGKDRSELQKSPRSPQLVSSTRPWCSDITASMISSIFKKLPRRVFVPEDTKTSATVFFFASDYVEIPIPVEVNEFDPIILDALRTADVVDGPLRIL